MYSYVSYLFVCLSLPFSLSLSHRLISHRLSCGSSLLWLRSTAMFLLLQSALHHLLSSPALSFYSSPLLLLPPLLILSLSSPLPHWEWVVPEPLPESKDITIPHNVFKLDLYILTSLTDKCLVDWTTIPSKNLASHRSFTP